MSAALSTSMRGKEGNDSTTDANFQHNPYSDDPTELVLVFIGKATVVCGTR